MNFKNRIAFHYLIATASIMALAFLTIYLIVWNTVQSHIDSELQFEVSKHIGEVSSNHDGLSFFNRAEWEEREHREVQVHPVFIQLMNARGELMDKSPNLKDGYLNFDPDLNQKVYRSTLNGQEIKQVQYPIIINNETIGYLIAALNSEPYDNVLINLRNTLLISYFLIGVLLYFASYVLAGRSIVPVSRITSTISRISRHNLNERVHLPENHDEIYLLSQSFNSLLDRIEDTLSREKQFTSDASHELRTPLASLRGNLEVLIRKQRSIDEYEEKIKFCLKEIDRMSRMVDQLLQLARLDEKEINTNEPKGSFLRSIHESIDRHQTEINAKNLKLGLKLSGDSDLELPITHSALIIDNLLSNSIKYSKPNDEIIISLLSQENQKCLMVKDHGRGIKKDDIKLVFNSFYRSEALQNKEIEGSGLGLSIVKKCVSVLNGSIEIRSELNQGTTVEIKF